MSFYSLWMSRKNEEEKKMDFVKQCYSHKTLDLYHKWIRSPSMLQRLLHNKRHTKSFHRTYLHKNVQNISILCFSVLLLFNSLSIPTVSNWTLNIFFYSIWASYTNLSIRCQRCIVYYTTTYTYTSGCRNEKHNKIKTINNLNERIVYLQCRC